MSEWITYTLGEVTKNFDSVRVPVKSTERVPGPYPYYGASGIVDSVSDYLFDGEYLLIAEDGENLRTRGTPIAFMATGKFWVNNHAHVVQGNHLANTRFLCYVLARTDISGYLSGSTQPKLTQASLNLIKVKLPSMRQQDAIVDLLGALDDKIAINERIAITAESLALALACGKRWQERVRLEEICLLRKDQISPQGIFSGFVDHYSLPAFDASKMPERVPPESIKSGKFSITTPVVLLSKLNPGIPRVWNVTPNPEVLSLASAEFLVLTPREPLTTHELWAVTSQQDFLNNLASRVTGTSKSHQRVRPTEVMATEVIDPRQFGETALQIRNLSGRAALARRESQTLATLRDTLLPQLMSGRLRVQDAEKIVEDHA